MLNGLKRLFGRKETEAAVPDVSVRVDALYAQAVDAWNRSHCASAASLAAEAIALDLSLPVLHFLRASALLELGDHAGCVAAAEAGLALSPPYPLANDLCLRRALAMARSHPGLAQSQTGLAPGQPTLALGQPNQPRSEVSPAPAAAPDDPQRRHFISVIICSITPAKLERVTRNYQRLMQGVEHEIIAITDAKSLCEGYNRGVRQARGDLLVFSHDDLQIVSEDFAIELKAAFESHDLIGVAGTTEARGAAWMFSGWPHLFGQIGMPAGTGASEGSITVTAYRTPGKFTEGIQAMDGVFMAARRELVEAIGFDADTFDGWHLYDMDFSFRAHQAGYRCATLNSLLIVHDSAGNPGEDWKRYAQRFAAKHPGIPALAEDGSEFAPPPLSGISVRSAEEWRHMSTHLVGTPLPPGEGLG